MARISSDAEFLWSHQLGYLAICQNLGESANCDRKLDAHWAAKDMTWGLSHPIQSPT